MPRALRLVLARLTMALGVLLLTSAAAGKPVVPPGQDELMGSMLDGYALPGQCQFTGASLGPTLVTATFDCGPHGNTVEVELRHPSAGGTVLTKKFALTLTSGAPQAGLLEALAQHIRPREQEWQWSEATQAPGWFKMGHWRSVLVWSIPPVLVLLIALLVVAARRRRRAKSPEVPSPSTPNPEGPPAPS